MVAVNNLFMNFALEVKDGYQRLRKYRTHSRRRFLKYLRTIKWQEGHISAYLRINYGKYEDNFGQVVPFYNDGEYKNENDLWKAFTAFTEGARPY